MGDFLLYHIINQLYRKDYDNSLSLKVIASVLNKLRKLESILVPNYNVSPMNVESIVEFYQACSKLKFLKEFECNLTSKV